MRWAADVAARGKPDARRAACPGWVPLIAYVWAASVVVPIVVFVLIQGRAVDMAAMAMVMCMWVPSFILANGMLAVFLAKVPGRGAGAGRCAAIWGAALAFHVLFAAGAVGRIDQARADFAAQALFTATAVAYVVVLVLATRAIKAGERAGPS